MVLGYLLYTSLLIMYARIAFCRIHELLAWPLKMKSIALFNADN